MCAVLLAHVVTMACDISYLHFVLVPCTYSAVLMYSTFVARCMAWPASAQLLPAHGRAHCLSHDSGPDSGQMPQQVQVPVPNPKLVGLHNT